MIRRFFESKNEKRALTDRGKHDIMKFQGILCDGEQPKGGVG